MRHLESLKKKYREINQMLDLTQTPQARKSLSNMRNQNLDELYEFIDKINTRHSLDFEKWVKRKKYV